MNEQWKDVIGFEGVYQVSDQGRVKSLNRKDSRGHTRPGKILQPIKHGAGYLYVNLSNANIANPTLIHRIVLEAFVGTCPNNMEACHLDCNKHNNQLSNLRWDTRAGNRVDSINAGTIARGERVSSAKLTASAVYIIKHCIDPKHTQASIAKAFGVGQEAISRIRTGKRWNHVS